jgi:hypothetical protein
MMFDAINAPALIPGMREMEGMNIEANAYCATEALKYTVETNDGICPRVMFLFVKYSGMITRVSESAAPS